MEQASRKHPDEARRLPENAHRPLKDGEVYLPYALHLKRCRANSLKHNDRVSPLTR